MGNKDKDKKQTSKGASGDSALSSWDAHQANRDLSQERDARDATLAKQVAEAVAREMVRLMHSTRPYSMREVQLQCQSALR